MNLLTNPEPLNLNLNLNMSKPNQHQKLLLRKIKTLFPEEYKRLLEAVKYTGKMDGMSIQKDNDTLQKVWSALNFKAPCKEVETVKERILKTATDKFKNGAFGNGVYLID